MVGVFCHTRHADKVHLHAVLVVELVVDLHAVGGRIVAYKVWCAVVVVAHPQQSAAVKHQAAEAVHRVSADGELGVVVRRQCAVF